MGVVDFEADFLAQMQKIFRVVAGDGDGLAVDKAVQRERGVQRGDLFQDLLQSPPRSGGIVQTVTATAVLKKDGRLVFEQILFGWVVDAPPSPNLFLSVFL